MYTKAHSVHRNMEEGEVPPNPLVKKGLARTVHRGPGAHAPPKPSTCLSRWGEGGTGGEPPPLKCLIKCFYILYLFH